ncbi:butyrate kinase [Macrococcus equipercicus]|uniref:Probable butyrate kinase n=1 Tax=Macrococcus equipercicus TaxID=69967 RepID=A0A9Q9F0F9_9STAP|nr:butyrate kinase [Macrococcus equipercicus]KAA1040139.1 butyrate kinase [Macrococcus equipercicus]UTH12913.1 butyrate kinase [Macrococcus equipercicus]
MAHILTLNLGSTSSKIALFDDHTCVITETLRHTVEEVSGTVEEQTAFRLQVVNNFLQNHHIETFDAIAARGGLLKPISGGTYLINEAMTKDLLASKYGSHASNISTLLGGQLSKAYNKPAYIVDPVVVDEMSPMAKMTGLKFMERRSIFHALNQKAVARNYAERINRSYEELNLIVAHLGGGITVGTHAGGRVVDVNDGLSGEGPFSPERAGSLPANQLARHVIESQLTIDDVAKLLSKRGGFVSHFGTTDAIAVEQRALQGDAAAVLAYEAMAYQISKSIAAASVYFNGSADQIIMTGGLAYSNRLVNMITERVQFIAGVTVMPGEKEMEALTAGVLRVLNKEEQPKVYA